MANTSGVSAATARQRRRPFPAAHPVAALWAVVMLMAALPGASVRAQQTATTDSNQLPLLVSDSNTGYIDNAIVGTHFRIQFDAAHDIDRPDRGEFFYAKCGCFRVVGADPSAPGPAPGGFPANTRVIETSIDAYSLRLSGEYALRDDFSLFFELPITALDAEVIDDTTGLGDIQFGLKYAVLATPRRHLTFQLRAYAPSGSADRGLGTDHWSLEPGLLYFDQLSPRATLAAELRYFLSIDGSSGRGTGFSEDFDSDVLRYGIGVSYDLNPGSAIKVTPVAELVGWHLFGGLESFSSDGFAPPSVFKAGGTDIVNLKLGARVRWTGKDSLYLGAGFALTDDSWYESILRLEYRHTF